MPAPDPSDEALAAAEELLADDNAPVLSNGEHSWLKHNIARLCDFFAAEQGNPEMVSRAGYNKQQPHQKLGDAPIQAEYRAKMEAVARGVDVFFNGDTKGDARKTGFVLMVFPFGDTSGRCNYMSNGADRRDIVTLMKEMIARFEGQLGIEGST